MWGKINQLLANELAKNQLSMTLEKELSAAAKNLCTNMNTASSTYESIFKHKKEYFKKEIGSTENEFETTWQMMQALWAPNYIKLDIVSDIHYAPTEDIRKSLGKLKDNSVVIVPADQNDPKKGYDVYYDDQKIMNILKKDLPKHLREYIKKLPSDKSSVFSDKADQANSDIHRIISKHYFEKLFRITENLDRLMENKAISEEDLLQLQKVLHEFSNYPDAIKRDDYKFIRALESALNSNPPKTLLDKFIKDKTAELELLKKPSTNLPADSVKPPVAPAAERIAQPPRPLPKPLSQPKPPASIQQPSTQPIPAGPQATTPKQLPKPPATNWQPSKPINKALPKPSSDPSKQDAKPLGPPPARPSTPPPPAPVIPTAAAANSTKPVLPKTPISTKTAPATPPRTASANPQTQQKPSTTPPPLQNRQAVPTQTAANPATKTTRLPAGGVRVLPATPGQLNHNDNSVVSKPTVMTPAQQAGVGVSHGKALPPAPKSPRDNDKKEKKPLPKPPTKPPK